MQGEGKLGVEQIQGEWRIAWIFVDDIGAILGEDKEDGKAPAPANPDLWEHWAASKAILEAFPYVERDRWGFHWERTKEARSALRVAKEAIRVKPGQPLPEWAIKALAAGWKRPKGWQNPGPER